MARKTEPSTEVQLLASINDTLAYLLAITALNYTAGKNQQVAIKNLAAAGLPAKAISDMTGWPTTTVAPIVSRTKGGIKSRANNGRPVGKRATRDGHQS